MRKQKGLTPEQAKTVRMIYRDFLEGDSISVIKEKLEAAGALTPTGKSVWSTTTIQSILTNEKYKGDALLCKRQNRKKPRFYRGFLYFRVPKSKG